MLAGLLFALGSVTLGGQPATETPMPHQDVKNRLKAAGGGKLPVLIEGTVANHLDTRDGQLPGYHLRDATGILLLVRTTKPLPEVDTKILVSGVAMIDREPPFRDTTYVFEEERTLAPRGLNLEIKTTMQAVKEPAARDEAGPAGTGAPEAKLPETTTDAAALGRDGGVTKTDGTEPDGADGKSLSDFALIAGRTPADGRTSGGTSWYARLTWPWITGFGLAGGALLVGGLVFLLSRRQPSSSATAPSSSPGYGPQVYSPASPHGADDGLRLHEDRAPAPVGVDDYKTVKAYKTSKVLPGRLVVMENGAETDIIHLSDQSGRGEIEIGRDSPDATSGIRIKDKSNTLSRRQARLMYDAEKREFAVMNLVGDSGNPTMLNGRSMRENEAAVLKDGDVLAMGNVELRFRLK